MSALRCECQDRAAAGVLVPEALEGCDPAAQERARVGAALAGFEDRLRRCRGELWSFAQEHRSDARCASELAFLLGQMHAVMAHCLDLAERYRLERVALAARDASSRSAGS